MDIREFNEQQNNPYYIGYHIVISCMQHNNVFNGLSKSLLLAKMYLHCDDIILYKLNNENHYEQFNSTPYLNDNYESIIEILNKRDREIREQQYLDFSLDEKDIHRLTIIPISFKEYNYRMVIVNNSIMDKNKNEEFMIILNKSFEVILDKMENYHKIIKLSNQDGLTKLENRLSYMIKSKELDLMKQHITFVYLDLFQLKSINDLYGHQIGDMYIIKTAEILKKYFPSYKFSSKAYMTSKKFETGDNVYRVGGDEFVVLSTNKTTEQVEELMANIVQEVEKIGLSINNNPITSINYGISERCNMESMDELYKMADERLYENKNAMYKKLSVDRRRKK